MRLYSFIPSLLMGPFFSNKCSKSILWNGLAAKVTLKLIPDWPAGSFWWVTLRPAVQPGTCNALLKDKHGNHDGRPAALRTGREARCKKRKHL